MYTYANWPYIQVLGPSFNLQLPFLPEGNFLFESCDCGVKSSGTKGGSDKKVFDMYQKCLCRQWCAGGPFFQLTKMICLEICAKVNT